MRCSNVIDSDSNGWSRFAWMIALCRALIRPTLCRRRSVWARRAHSAMMTNCERRRRSFSGRLRQLSRAGRRYSGGHCFGTSASPPDGETSCASCHRLEDYGTDRRVVSRRATGTITKRNSKLCSTPCVSHPSGGPGTGRSGAEQAERSITGSMGLGVA